MSGNRGARICWGTSWAEWEEFEWLWWQFSSVTHKNFRIKRKGSQDLVPYRLNAPEVLKMHLVVSCCLRRFFESGAKKVRGMLWAAGGAGAAGLFPFLAKCFP